MNIQFIYALICPEEGIIKYIGKTKDLRLRLQGHINYALQKSHLNGKHEWIRTLYTKNLKPVMQILEQCTDETWQEREAYWISFYAKTHTLFNKTSGGEDFVFKSGNNPWNKGGGKFSDESRRKMSLSHIGKILSEDQKSKIGESLRKPKSNEHSMNIMIGKSKKIVQQLDLEDTLIAEFSNTKFAAEAVGCSRESIRDVCDGFKRIKTCKGFKWKYKTNNYEI